MVLYLPRTFGEEGGDMELVNPLYMNIVLLSIGVLLSISLIHGWMGCNDVTFGLEINLLNSPFYKLGIFSERYNLEDGSVEDEIIIGLFLININIIFWKEAN